MKRRRVVATDMTASEAARLAHWSRAELEAIGLTHVDVFRARVWLRRGGSPDVSVHKVQTNAARFVKE